MLKITDSSGEVVGILEDEDSAPKMIEKKVDEELEDEQEEEEDGSTNRVRTVRTVAKSGSGSSEAAS